MPTPIPQAVHSYQLANGRTLAQDSERQPVLLIFLRHVG
jgi:hypothetical protein